MESYNNKSGYWRYGSRGWAYWPITCISFFAFLQIDQLVEKLHIDFTVTKTKIILLKLNIHII